MQAALSKVWTSVTVSISCDDNHYITSHFNIYIYIYIERERVEIYSFHGISTFVGYLMRKPSLEKKIPAN